MLWSLVKIILFMAVVAGMALGAGYLLESSGGVQITVGGYEFTFGPLDSVIALIVLVVLIWLLLKTLGLLLAIWKWIIGDETALRRYFDRSRERRGYDAVSQSLMALASGEGQLALSKAEKAHRDLNKPELTELLTAQAAEMAGDKRKAEETYKKLVQHDSTRFVGIRGIMKQKLSVGDTETAMKLAEKAFALKPKHVETQDVLLKLQATAQDWGGARKTLTAKLKHGALPRDVHRRRDAIMALSQAKAQADEESIDFQTAAIEANRLSPDLIPAAVAAAHSHINKGKPKYATRILKKAWERQPHPELAAAFAAINPDEDPKSRLKRFSALTRLHPDDPETRMLLAEVNIAAEDFPAARRALGDLVETRPTTRSVTLMAAIERGEGATDAIVNGWLAKAISAPRGPQWVCDNCQHIHSAWVPVCENCESFDTLAWTDPPLAEVVSPTGVQMLPLIVGVSDEPDAELIVVEEEGPIDIEQVDAEAHPETQEASADTSSDSRPA